MAVRSMKEDDPLEDFARREITLDGVAKRVYVAGSGSAVIVMTEMPGISPHVTRFARWVRDANDSCARGDGIRHGTGSADGHGRRLRGLSK
jgi:hypothetical protein